jgi:hypothetical protein
VQDLLLGYESVISSHVIPDVFAIGSCQGCQLAAHRSLALTQRQSNPCHTQPAIGTQSLSVAWSQQLKQRSPLSEGMSVMAKATPGFDCLYLLWRGISRPEQCKQGNAAPSLDGNKLVMCLWFHNVRLIKNLKVYWLWHYKASSQMGSVLMAPQFGGSSLA